MIASRLFARIDTLMLGLFIATT